MLDLYEEVDREISIKGRRWVMSHINVISPRERDRIVKLGLVLTTQTNNYLYKSLERNAAKLKPEQHDDIVPLKSLREAGVPVSLATDNTPITLWQPMQQTVLRQAFGSGRAFGEGQALSRDGGAALRDRQRRLSDVRRNQERLAGGRQVCRSHRAQRQPVDRRGGSARPSIASLMTMVGGKIVHETSGWSG